MSANVETMMYVKKPVWHGIGQRLEDAPNSKEALFQAGLDWNVNPTSVVVNNMVVPNYKANVRDKDNKVLGIVSDRYQIVQNLEAFEFVDNLIGSGDVRYESAGSLANGKRVWLLAQMEGTKLLGDDIVPYLVFSNSFDGSGSIKVALTNIRVVCQNTLTLALKSAKRTWSVKHAGDIQGKIHEAETTLKFARNYLLGINEEAELLQDIKLSEQNIIDFLHLAYPTPIGKTATDRKIANMLYMREQFMLMYKNIDDVQKFGNTAYKLYNVASDFITHFEPLRITDTYRENKFMSMSDGDKTLQLVQDFAYSIR